MEQNKRGLICFIQHMINNVIDIWIVVEIAQQGEKCIEDVYDYLISDDEEMSDLTKNTKEDWVLTNEFEIVEHEEEFEETVY